MSRTRNWSAVRRPFIHQGPLLARKDVSLARELAQPPPELKQLSRKQGAAVMDLIREVMLVRYRELYGTTLGDPASVVRSDVGRGVEIYLWNLPPVWKFTPPSCRNAIPASTIVQMAAGTARSNSSVSRSTIIWGSVIA